MKINDYIVIFHVIEMMTKMNHEQLIFVMTKKRG